MSGRSRVLAAIASAGASSGSQSTNTTTQSATATTQSATSPSSVSQPAPDPWTSSGGQAALSTAAQQQATAQAALTSPAMVSARQASKTQYENQSGSQALSTGEQTFPDAVGAPGFKSVSIPGATITQKLNDYLAVVQDASGRKLLAVGSGSLYGKESDGSSAPVNLGLSPQGNSFVPRSAVVPVSIPASSGGEVSFTDDNFGVEFGSGTAVAGQVAGGSVFYPNIGGASSDTDAVVRAQPAGAEISFVLRSQQSPESQVLAFDMPAGWKLQDPQDGSGTIDVVSASGSQVATIAPAVATDAQGQPVPVSYQVQDATHLMLTVAHQGGDYTYPILVDPQVYDDHWDGAPIEEYWEQYKSPTNAAFTPSINSGTYAEWSGNYSTNYTAGNTAEFYRYAPTGAYIASWTLGGVFNNPDHSSEYAGLWLGTGGWDSGSWSATSGSPSSGSGAERSANYSENPTENVYFTDGDTSNNAAIFGVTINTTASSGSNLPYVSLGGTELYYAANQVPSLTGTVGHANYVPNSWVHDATDTVTVNSSVSSGLGIGLTKLVITPPGQSASSQTDTNSCPDAHSVTVTPPCSLTQSAQFTLDTDASHLNLPEGTTQVQAYAYTASGKTWSPVPSSASWDINIDRTAPTLTLGGTLAGDNNTTLDDGQYALSMTAHDGSGATPSSGVAQITIAVDGTPQSGVSVTPCSPGPCQGTGSWTLDTSALAAGPHTITVTATDGAGNATSQTIMVTVRHADSEQIGPGSVSLGSGEFTYSATDADVPGFEGDLSITRSFSSEHITGTTTSPLGPGWSVSLPQGTSVGSFQSLSVAPDGSGATLTDTGGGQSKWTLSNGTYSAPPGAQGLTLTGPTSPVGTVNEFHAGISSGAGPAGVATGSDGDVWFAENGGNRIAKLAPATDAVTEYPIPTSNSQPFGIAAGPDGNMWFSENNMNKIGKITTSGAISEYTIPSSASKPGVITAGPDGNMWFVETGTGKIGKITPSGAITEYTIPANGEGAAAPWGLITGSDGALWFTDDTHNAIGRITTSGAISEYPLPTGSAEPTQIAAGADGALWFAEFVGNKIGRITTGGHITEYSGLTSGSGPLWITSGADGNLWFTEYWANKVASINPQSTTIHQYTAPTGSSGLYGIASGPDGNIWLAENAVSQVANVSLNAFTLTDTDGNERIFTPSANGQYQAAQTTQPDSSGGLTTSVVTYQTVPGASGSTEEPLQTTSAATGVNCITAPLTTRGCRTLAFTYATTTGTRSDCPSGWGDYAGRLTTVSYDAYNTVGDSNYAQGWHSSAPGSAYPAIAVTRYCYDSTGLLRAVFDPRISDSPSTELDTEYTYDGGGRVSTIASPGLNAWTMTYGAIADDSNPGRLLSVSRQDPTNGAATYTMAYHVPLTTAAGGPYDMNATSVAAWDEKASVDGLQNVPTDATAIFPPDVVPSSPPSDYNRATIYYMDTDGDTVNEAHPGGRISTTEYDSNANVIRELTPADRAEALSYGQNSSGESDLLDTEYTYTSDGVAQATEVGPTHLMQLANGVQVDARTETVDTYDYGNPGGGATDLPTTETVESSYGGSDQRTTTFQYGGQNGLGWTLGQPTSVTTDPNGLNAVTTALYDPSTSSVTDTIQPAGDQSGGDPHDAQTIYYTAAPNSTYPNCGAEPDVAGQVCQTQPAAQPNTPGLPALPASTYTYDIWGDTVTETDTSGTSTRTTTNTYDPAGRLHTTLVSSAVGQALPAISYGYDATTGLPTTQTANAQTITTDYNAIGEQTGYTDADGNLSASTYDIDGRLHTLNDGKGTQTYGYDSTTGDLVSVGDSGIGTFAATYNADGNMLTETYPTGMTAAYTYDETGTPTNVTYTAPSGCTSGCTWYSDNAIASAQGQWLHQASTLATDNYVYDAAGSLTQVQETPTGQGCTTRQYTYDGDTNRNTSTTIMPGSGGACETAGGVTAHHTYDSGDRLEDGGVTYNAWGDTLTLPASDAGGASLSNSYYVDDALYAETQAGVTVTENIDPDDRVRERVTTGASSGDEVDHFSGDSDNPAWTSSGSLWTRYVPGPDGQLAAVESSNGAGSLELGDLHGDVIGTVANSQTATPVLQQDTDEFGVPNAGVTPQRYDWEGRRQRTTSLPSGIIDMGVRQYDPVLGRFLQTDPTAGGSAGPYDYASGDPVNSMDPDGEAKIPADFQCTGTLGIPSVNAIFETVSGSASFDCKVDLRAIRAGAFTVGQLCIDAKHDGGRARWAEITDTCTGWTHGGWIVPGHKKFKVTASGPCKGGFYMYREHGYITEAFAGTGIPTVSGEAGNSSREYACFQS
jgi:RHS repeat-associated protein